MCLFKLQRCAHIQFVRMYVYMCAHLTGRPTWKVVGILRRMAGSTSCGLFVAPITITYINKNHNVMFCRSTMRISSYVLHAHLYFSKGSSYDNRREVLPSNYQCNLCRYSILQYKKELWLCYLGGWGSIQAVPQTHELGLHHSCGFMVQTGAVPQKWL